MTLSRRNFLKNTPLQAVAIVSIPAIVASCVTSEKKETKNVFNLNDVVLFQGDSITDAGREKERELPNSPWSFGTGYSFLAASVLLNDFAGKNLTIYNRGISGNKVYQLAERWEKDCILLKPNLLSILIGINDYWHKRNGHYDGTIEIYENDFRKLLTETKNKFPDLKLVICEPFAVKDTKSVDESWMAPVNEYQVVAKKMADEFGAIWVPYQAVFDEAVKVAPPTYWTADGVHPSMAGAQLMAEAWLKFVV